MRTLQALELLAFTDLSSSELAATLNINPRTARRLLERLVAEGYADPIGDRPRRYRAAVRLSVLGRQLINRASLPRAAVPSVVGLSAKVGATAHLWIPSYRSVLCILHVDNPESAETTEPLLREQVPAHASAPGKVLLSHRVAWRNSLVAWPLERYTERTLTDPHKLCTALDLIRDQEYAIEHGEHRPATTTIAAPVFLGDEAVAAIGITMSGGPPTAPAHEAIGSHVTETARVLTLAVNHADHALPSNLYSPCSRDGVRISRAS
jgi:DNA-binding IclR family transcriptional regulator